MATDRLPAKGGRAVLCTLSLASGIAGVLLLPVLFPDASVAFGVLAIVTGIPVLGRGPLTRPRLLAMGGILIGVALLLAAAISVLAGNEEESGGGRAFGADTSVVMPRL